MPGVGAVDVGAGGGGGPGEGDGVDVDDAADALSIAAYVAVSWASANE